MIKPVQLSEDDQGGTLKMKRLEFIHISDLHFGQSDDIDDYNVKIFKYIKKNYPGIPVLITGDVTEDGDEIQYMEAKKRLKKLSRTNPILAVPGNHDYNHFGNIKNPVSDGYWKKYFGPPMGWKGKRLKNWLLAPCKDKKIKFDGDGLGVWVREDDGYAIFGIDSGDPKDYVHTARGWVSEGLRLCLKKELDKHKDLVRIVMLHHHPFMVGPFMSLDGAKELMDALRGSCDLLLFGHKHKYQFYRQDMHDEYGIPLIIACNKSPEVILLKKSGIIPRWPFGKYLVIQLIQIQMEGRKKRIHHSSVQIPYKRRDSSFLYDPRQSTGRLRNRFYEWINHRTSRIFMFLKHYPGFNYFIIWVVKHILFFIGIMKRLGTRIRI